MNAKQLIKELQLQAHVEGGFFRRTYESPSNWSIQSSLGQRHTMTSIFYLLTDEAGIGQWHLNESDIVHYYQLGNPLHYSMIDRNGNYEQCVLGPNICAGHKLQLTVRGGTWKSSRLLNGDFDFGLVSEAVSPGWHPDDMQMIDQADLAKRFPELQSQIYLTES